MKKLPLLSKIVMDIGLAGQQLFILGAAAASSGNISVYTSKLSVDTDIFPHEGRYELPAPAPALEKGWLVVTGTGCRVRDVLALPEENLCVLNILPGGLEAEMYSYGGVRPSTELNSHLAVHNDQVQEKGFSIHAVVHAQPLNLAYLSHLPAYSNTRTLSRRLVRWQPETIIAFPRGIGLLPFWPPGSPEQMAATLEGMRSYHLVVWQRHGTVSRSDVSAVKAADLVEYAEFAAKAEVLNLSNPNPSAGLSDDELLRICDQYGVKQEII